VSTAPGVPESIKMIRSAAPATDDLPQKIAACEAKIATVHSDFTAGLEAFRLEQGGNLHEYSELIRQEGTRDFIKTVEEKWGYKKPTVYRWIRKYKDAHGIGETPNPQPDRPSPQGDLRRNTILEQLARREGAVAAPDPKPAGPPPKPRTSKPEFALVKLSPITLSVTESQRARFKALRDDDGARIYELFKDLFLEVIGSKPEEVTFGWLEEGDDEAA
jgi:hypothetical protein